MMGQMTQKDVRITVLEGREKDGYVEEVLMRSKPYAFLFVETGSLLKKMSVMMAILMMDRVVLTIVRGL